MGDKPSILDVKAKDGRGQRYNVEMQVDVPRFWHKRAFYYAASLYTAQIGESELYSKLNRTISISILDGIFFHEYKELHNCYEFRNIRTGDSLSDLVELHFLELKKFDKDKPRRLSTRFEKWLHTLKFGTMYKEADMALPEELQNEEGISEVLELMRYGNSSEEIRQIMESRAAYRRDVFSEIEDAKDIVREEERKLREEAVKQERKLREEAVQKERKEREQMIIQMLQQGISIEVIMSVSGLSAEEIQKLREE
jgi:predicted transposase/invertase (TIGR01784 family)